MHRPDETCTQNCATAGGQARAMLFSSVAVPRIGILAPAVLGFATACGRCRWRGQLSAQRVLDVVGATSVEDRRRDGLQADFTSLLCLNRIGLLRCPKVIVSHLTFSPKRFGPRRGAERTEVKKDRTSSTSLAVHDPAPRRNPQRHSPNRDARTPCNSPRPG